MVLAISPNTDLDINFANSLNLLCSCSLETESKLHFSLRCENYTTLHRALLTEKKKKNNDAIMSLNENDLLHVILRILTTT